MGKNLWDLFATELFLKGIDNSSLDLTCKIIEYSDWVKKAENWVQASI